jgi:hypothetical protein
MYYILNIERIKELCLKIPDAEKEECLRTVHNDIEI